MEELIRDHVRKEAKHEWAGKAQDLSLDQEGDTSACQRLETVNLVLKLHASSQFCCCGQELHCSFDIGGICVLILFPYAHLPWPGMSGIGSRVSQSCLVKAF